MSRGGGREECRRSRKGKTSVSTDGGTHSPGNHAECLWRVLEFRSTRDGVRKGNRVVPQEFSHNVEKANRRNC